MNGEDRPMFRPWMIVGLLWLVAMLNYLDRLMITTMRDSIKADISMTDAQFGLLTAVFLWIYGALSPLGGFLADRYSRSRVIIGSILVWSIITFLTGLCTTFEQLFWARALMGISEACYIPAALALIADYHRGSTRSLATGIHMSGVYAGSALGGIGGVIAERFSWQVGFSGFGIFGVLYAVVLVLLLRDVKHSESGPVVDAGELQGDGPDGKGNISPFSAVKDLLTKPSFYVMVCHVSLLALAFWGINGWLPTCLKEHFKMGQGAAGMSATGYIQVASFFGILIGGTLADRWIRRSERGRIWVPMIGFAIAGPCLFMSASTDIFYIAIIGLVIFGLARGFSDANMMPILCQVVDKRYRATGYGVMNFCSCMVGGAMIYVGGWLKDNKVDLSRIFQVAAVGLFIAAMLLFLVKPKKEEQ